jgi:hypothetical protein
MSDQQKVTVSYGRNPSMDLPEADAAAEFSQCLEDLQKVDPNIPPMPEGDLNDPLSLLSRWTCEYFWLPLLAEDVMDEARKIPAIWKGLRLIATHRLPPPEWLASEMLADGFPALPRKNAASLFIEDIERFHAVASAIYRVQKAGEKAGLRFSLEDIINDSTKHWNEPAKRSNELNWILHEARRVLIDHRSNSQRQTERMLEMFRRFNERCDQLP